MDLNSKGKSISVAKEMLKGCQGISRGMGMEGKEWLRECKGGAKGLLWVYQ